MTFQFNHDLLLAEVEREAAKGLISQHLLRPRQCRPSRDLRRFQRQGVPAKEAQPQFRLSRRRPGGVLAAPRLVRPRLRRDGVGQGCRQRPADPRRDLGIAGVVMGLFGTMFPRPGAAVAAESLRGGAPAPNFISSGWSRAPARSSRRARTPNSARPSSRAARRNTPGFASDMLGHLEAELAAIIEDEDSPPCWMIPASSASLPPLDDPVLQELFSAYERLASEAAAAIHGLSPARRERAPQPRAPGGDLQRRCAQLRLHRVRPSRRHSRGAVGGRDWPWEPLVNTFGNLGPPSSPSPSAPSKRACVRSAKSNGCGSTLCRPPHHRAHQRRGIRRSSPRRHARDGRSRL